MSRILLVVVSNDSRYHWYPLGIVSLANELSHHGHNVSIWHQDARLDPPGVLAELLDRKRYVGFDSVGIGWMAGKVPHANALALCDIARPHVKHLVIGGHGPSGAPEWYLERTRSDAVVVGEGEGACEGWMDLRGIVRPPRPRADQYNPWPDRETSPPTAALARWYYPMVPAPGAGPLDRVWPVLSGFGCPHRCSFCFRLPGQGCRPRSATAIRLDIEMAIGYGATYVQFQDELLMTNPARVVEICEMITAKFPRLRWSCQGRVDVAAAHPEILPVMAAAGCRFVNYGVESTSQAVLDSMGKRQTVEESHRAMSATLDAGISPGVNMLWGCPGDSEESLWSNVEFVLRYSDHAQRRTIRPVTPYPGSRLYDQAVAEGKVKDVGDFYEKLVNSDLVTVDFADIPRDRAHELLCEANTQLLRAHHKAVAAGVEEQARRLYLDGDPDFRGWRQI